jgi:hypothetical protein
MRIGATLGAVPLQEAHLLLRDTYRNGQSGPSRPAPKKGKQARKALQLVRQAVEAETLTLELARRVAAYLDKARLVPELRFVR